jgi:predicted GIY-YIG superfamily endonuclease
MYVYIIETTTQPQPKYYTGLTKNLKQRLHDHNAGKCKFTSAYVPWRYKNVVWFRANDKAYRFERYLKSGSGRSFANMHF